jgi:hypothetical protein
MSINSYLSTCVGTQSPKYLEMAQGHISLSLSAPPLPPRVRGPAPALRVAWARQRGLPARGSARPCARPARRGGALAHPRPGSTRLSHGGRNSAVAPGAAPTSCAGPPWLLARGHGLAAASARCAAPSGSAACSRSSPAWLAHGNARRGLLAWLARNVVAWRPPWRPSSLAAARAACSWRPARRVAARP